MLCSLYRWSLVPTEAGAERQNETYKKDLDQQDREKTFLLVRVRVGNIC